MLATCAWPWEWFDSNGLYSAFINWGCYSICQMNSKYEDCVPRDGRETMLLRKKERNIILFHWRIWAVRNDCISGINPLWHITYFGDAMKAVAVTGPVSIMNRMAGILKIVIWPFVVSGIHPDTFQRPGRLWIIPQNVKGLSVFWQRVNVLECAIYIKKWLMIGKETKQNLKPKGQ